MNEKYRSAVYHLRWSVRHLRAGIGETVAGMKSRIHATKVEEVAEEPDRGRVTRIRTRIESEARSLERTIRSGVDRVRQRVA